MGFNFQFTIQMALLPFHFFYLCPHTIAQRQILSILIFFNLSNVHLQFSCCCFRPYSLPLPSLSHSPSYIPFLHIHSQKEMKLFILLQSPLWSLWKIFNNFMRLFFSLSSWKIKRIEMKEVKHVCVYVNLNNLHNYIFAQMNRFQKSFTNIYIYIFFML